MEKKQSSVEWLVNQLIDKSEYKDLPNNYFLMSDKDIDEIIEQAKAMHKEEHEETWIDAKIEDKGDDYIGKEMTFQQYYKKTYGQ